MSFSAEFLAERRKHLENKREKVLSDINDLERRASLNVARHDEEVLLQKKYQIIERIDAAANRLSNGTYGLCQSCHQEIPITRLERMPDAPTCVTCSAVRRS